MTPAPLPFAVFHHPDGRWYRLWVARASSTAERGPVWQLHAVFSGTHEGAARWEFDERAEVVADFQERAAMRLAHGYELREGAVPQDY